MSTISIKSIISTRTFKSISAPTIIPANAGGYGVKLKHLCQLITEYPSLQTAEIVKSECYARRIASLAGVEIVHRYLVLELRRKGKKPIWVRLDRTSDKAASRLHMVRSGGRTKDNDTVSIYRIYERPVMTSRTYTMSLWKARLTARKDELIRGDFLENQQTFLQCPTLKALNHLLEVISKELTFYQLWPVCIWLECFAI